jgi:hypothetical protein
MVGAAALAAGLTAGTGFGGATGFGAGTDSGPNPVRTTARADAGGFWAAPSRSTGTPAAFAARSPFSTVSITGSSLRTSRNAESISAVAAPPPERSRAAISALTAAFPALRCNANSPGGTAAPRPLLVLRLPSTSASSRCADVASGVSRAPPIRAA